LFTATATVGVLAGSVLVLDLAAWLTALLSTGWDAGAASAVEP
jgi:hypothetical protein